MILKITILLLSQFVFCFSRTLNVRYTARENVPMSIITGIIIKITWLVSSAIGVVSVIDMDFPVIIAYIVGGVIGDYISFKIKIK